MPLLRERILGPRRGFWRDNLQTGVSDVKTGNWKKDKWCLCPWERNRLIAWRVASSRLAPSRQAAWRRDPAKCEPAALAMGHHRDTKYKRVAILFANDAESIVLCWLAKQEREKANVGMEGWVVNPNTSYRGRKSSKLPVSPLVLSQVPVTLSNWNADCVAENNIVRQKRVSQ